MVTTQFTTKFVFIPNCVIRKMTHRKGDNSCWDFVLKIVFGNKFRWEINYYHLLSGMDWSTCSSQAYGVGYFTFVIRIIKLDGHWLNVLFVQVWKHYSPLQTVCHASFNFPLICLYVIRHVKWTEVIRLVWFMQIYMYLNSNLKKNNK